MEEEKELLSGGEDREYKKKKKKKKSKKQKPGGHKMLGCPYGTNVAGKKKNFSIGGLRDGQSRVGEDGSIVPFQA